MANARLVLESWRFVREDGFHTEVMTLREFGRIYNGQAQRNVHFRWAYCTITLEKAG